MNQDTIAIYYREFRDKPEWPAIRGKIIKAHMYIPESLSKKFFSKHIDTSDILGRASLELVEVVDKYNPDGMFFKNYAWKMIRQAIIDEIIRNEGSIRIPKEVAKKITAIGKIRDNFYTVMGRYPTAGEIAKKAHISHYEVQFLLDIQESIKEYMDKSSEEDTCYCYESDLTSEATETVTELLSCLDQREKLIVTMGLNGSSIKDISDKVHLTTVSIYNMRRNAYDKMKDKAMTRTVITFEEFKRKARQNPKLIECSSKVAVICPGCGNKELVVDNKTFRVIGVRYSRRIYCSRCSFDEFV